MDDESLSFSSTRIVFFWSVIADVWLLLIPDLLASIALFAVKKSEKEYSPIKCSKIRDLIGYSDSSCLHLSLLWFTAIHQSVKSYTEWTSTERWIR